MRIIKIVLDIQPSYETVEVIIKCPHVDDNVTKLIEQIKQFDLTFQCEKGNKIYKLQADQLFYIESIDNKTFLYTKEHLYESSLKLYAFEKMTASTSFIRISKSLIVNTSKIISVRALFNGKFEATLENDEKVIVNRHYVKAFKLKFLK